MTLAVIKSAFILMAWGADATTEDNENSNDD